nr:hypothetical protein [uncultured Draconibacterium sp.]
MKDLKVFVLFGAPGSGKSEVCNILKSKLHNNIEIIRKETTRPARKTDSNEIIHVENISSKCDFRYSQYKYDYGFSSKEIWDNLKNNRSVIVIVNDIRTIKLLNRKFGNLTFNIYIHSNINKNKIEKIAKSRHPSANENFLIKDINKRIDKIRTIHRKYIENTYLFHSSIINIYDLNDPKSKYNLETQIEQIYTLNHSFKNIFGSAAHVIIIAGGSFSGKDDLVNAMIQIEPRKVALYRKGTTRPKTQRDKNELKHLNELTAKYDIQYEKNGYKYGICINDIWSILSDQKIALIVLSDIEAIEAIKNSFQNICSVIYLHSNIDSEELEEAQKTMNSNEFEKRLASIDQLLSSYISKIELFNHVLLNTSEAEDLYDQALNILDYYLGNAI